MGVSPDPSWHCLAPAGLSYQPYPRHPIAAFPQHLSVNAHWGSALRSWVHTPEAPTLRAAGPVRQIQWPSQLRGHLKRPRLI